MIPNNNSNFPNKFSEPKIRFRLTTFNCRGYPDPIREYIELYNQEKGRVTKFIRIREFTMMCPDEGNNTVNTLKWKIEVCFYLFVFKFFKIMNLGTHVGALRFQLTTSSLTSVIFLDLTYKLSIFLLGLTSHIFIKTNSLFYSTSKLSIQLHIYRVQFCPYF